MIAELPVSIADPLERLEALSAQMARLKASGGAEVAQLITAFADRTPPSLIALGLRAAAAVGRQFPQRAIGTVTTNIRGPEHTCTPPDEGWSPTNHSSRSAKASASVLRS
jgi:diacylglycerol O-acyltransferase / wax synthase